MIRFIGLTGKMASGKDTVFRIAAGISRRQIWRRAFGDSVKNEVAQACEVTIDRINKSKGLYRPILQWWGTEFRRGLRGEDYWIRKMRTELEGLKDREKDGLVIVTDVRFPNEADLVKSLGGRVVRVVRTGDAGLTAEHISETAMDGYPCDSSILNNGNLSDLEDKVKDLINAN